ncbi:MAG: KH domain-containing protein [Anaerolineales bacterium]
MTEQTTLEIIAPTVEEAISQGLAQLGLSADAVSIEVVDSGSKGLFGLGGRQVRVRLSVNPPPLPASLASVASALTPTGKAKPAKRKESAPKAPPRESKPAAQKQPARQEKAAPTPALKKIQPAQPDALLDAAESIVSKLVAHLGMKGQVSASYDSASRDDRRMINVDIRGDDLSGLIGKHAETLSAFQYVASLMVGRQTQQWVQLAVDVEGYRSRRERQVRLLAQRMAEQVTKTGKRAALEPMTASERRVVHIELRGHPAVTTESSGEEPHRKVIILPKKN